MLTHFSPVRVKIFHSHGQVPKRAHKDDAAFDLFAAEKVVVGVEAALEIPLGFALEIPVGWEAQIWPRSSDTLRGLYIHPGTIDAGYRGEVAIIVRSFYGTYVVERGERIGQIKFVRQSVYSDGTPVELVQVLEMSETDRGSKGFGSTGR